MLTAGRRATGALVLGGCGRTAMLGLDAGVAGRTIRIAKGSRLRLVLPETPSTGHRWRITADAAPVLRREEDAHLPGGAVLRLDDDRPWEPAPPAAQSAVMLQVEG